MFPLKLDPIAFSLGSLDVHWYGIILGAGALVGLLLAIQEGKRFGLASDFFLDLMLYGVPSAIIAARLYYVAFKWDYYRENPGEIVQIWNGGIAIYGALIGAILCGVIYTRKKGYKFSRIADICAPSLIAGQMIGRWGNFVNQEAYGGEAGESFLRDTLGLPAFIVDQMNVNGIYHHPTFLYESVWSLLGLALLFIIRRQRFMREGEVFLTYVIWYSAGRFFIEALRTDSLAFQGPDALASLLSGLWTPMSWIFGEQGYLDPAYGNIRISQLLALLLVICGVAAIIVRRAKGWATERYADPLVPIGQPAATSVGSDEPQSDEPQPDEPTSDEPDPDAGVTPFEGETAAGEEKPEPSDQDDGAEAADRREKRDGDQ